MTDMDIQGKRVFLDYLCKLIEIREDLKGNDHVVQFRSGDPLTPSFLSNMQVSMAYAAGHNVASIDALTSQKYNVFCCLGEGILKGLVENLEELDTLGDNPPIKSLIDKLESNKKLYSFTKIGLNRLREILTKKRDILSAEQLSDIVETENIKKIYEFYKTNLQIKILGGKLNLQGLDHIKGSIARVSKRSDKTPDLLLCLLNSDEETNNAGLIKLFKNKVIHILQGLIEKHINSDTAFTIMTPLGFCYKVTPDIVEKDKGWKDGNKFKSLGGNTYQKLGSKAHETTQLELDFQQARKAMPGTPNDDLKIVAALKSALHTVETLGNETADAVGLDKADPEEFQELHRKLDLIRDRASGQLQKKGNNARQKSESNNAQRFEAAEKARIAYYESKAPEGTPVVALMNEKDKLTQIKTLCKDSNYVKVYGEIIQKLQGIIDGYIKTLQKQLGETITRQDNMEKKMANLKGLMENPVKGGRRGLYKRTRRIRKNRIRRTKRARKGL